jgi:putative transposase
MTDSLNHLVILNEGSLRRILKSYFDYYLFSRSHVALSKDAPESRPIRPPELGLVIKLSEVGGLHHRYERQAA